MSFSICSLDHEIEQPPSNQLGLHRSAPLINLSQVQCCRLYEQVHAHIHIYIKKYTKKPDKTDKRCHHHHDGLNEHVEYVVIFVSLSRTRPPSRVSQLNEIFMNG